MSIEEKLPPRKVSGVMMRSGMAWSFSKPSAQIPMMKPMRLKVTEVRTRKRIIQTGCSILSGTSSAAVDLGDAPADRGAEDDEVQGCRDDRRDDALHQGTPGARHLELVDRAYRVDVHGAHFLSLTRVTKMSSSELCVVWRSLKRIPAAAKSCRSAVMPARSTCSS